jgi:ribosomal protein L7/L12
MAVPFLNLQRQFELIKEDVEKAEADAIKAQLEEVGAKVEFK